MLLITASSFFLLKFLRSLASPAYPPVPHNMEQVWRSIASFSRHAYEHALILSTKHCVVHSFISLAGVHSKVRTRCSEVGTEWLKSWNLFLVFRNKNLWGRNSVLGLGQADKPLLWKLSPYRKSLLHFELKSIYYVELQTSWRYKVWSQVWGSKLVNIDPLSYVKAS